MAPTRHSHTIRIEARDKVPTSTANVILGCTITFGILALVICSFLIYKAYLRRLDHAAARNRNEVDMLIGEHDTIGLTLQDVPETKYTGHIKARNLTGRATSGIYRFKTTLVRLAATAHGMTLNPDQDFVHDKVGRDTHLRYANGRFSPQMTPAGANKVRGQGEGDYRQGTPQEPYADENGKRKASPTPLAAPGHPASDISQLISAFDTSSIQGNARGQSHAGSLAEQSQQSHGDIMKEEIEAGRQQETAQNIRKSEKATTENFKIIGAREASQVE
ncbi:MAG: hypothetical protein Q9174_001329 [Haloplaca sp. 1 TL-2023]